MPGRACGCTPLQSPSYHVLTHGRWDGIIEQKSQYFTHHHYCMRQQYAIEVGSNKNLTCVLAVVILQQTFCNCHNKSTEGAQCIQTCRVCRT